MKTLVVFYSGKGFIREAADRIQKELGSDAALLDLGSKSKADLNDYDGVILCGAFRAGSLPRKLRAYVKKNTNQILTKKLAFVLGGLGIEEDEYMNSFEKNYPSELRSHASKTVHVGGRYIPEDYGKFIRKMMEKINNENGSIHREQWDNIKSLSAVFS